MAYQENAYQEQTADAEASTPGYRKTNYQGSNIPYQDYADQQYRESPYQSPGYDDLESNGWEYATSEYLEPQDPNLSYYEGEGYPPQAQTLRPYPQSRPYRRPIASEPSTSKDILVGLLGGVAGVIAMDLFSQQILPLLTQDKEGEESRDQGNGQPGNEQEQPLDSISLVGEQHRPNESATAALGRILYHWATDEDPNKKTKTTLSYGVHWAYGIGQGAVYASARGPVEGLDVAGGLAFGTALWLLGDEIVVPLLGLQGGPTASGVTNHLNRLAMHLVYGAATAATTQYLRRLM